MWVIISIYNNDYISHMCITKNIYNIYTYILLKINNKPLSYYFSIYDQL